VWSIKALKVVRSIKFFRAFRVMRIKNPNNPSFRDVVMLKGVIWAKTSVIREITRYYKREFRGAIRVFRQLGLFPNKIV
jgi:hypothetical protein